MQQEAIYYNDHGGIYCFFPFERLDRNNSGVFKIGNTQQSFQERLGSYHTYFVYGVWVICLIKVYPKRGKKLPHNFKSILNAMEEYVLKELEAGGSIVIVDKRRRWKAGRSEWVYTDPYSVKDAFQKTILRFKKEYPDLGFLLDSADIPKTIRAIQKSYDKAVREKGTLTAEYVFSVDPSHNTKNSYTVTEKGDERPEEEKELKRKKAVNRLLKNTLGSAWGAAEVPQDVDKRLVLRPRKK